MAGFHTKTGTVPPREGGSGSLPNGRSPIRQAGIIAAPRPHSVRRPFGYALRSAGPMGSEDGYNILVMDEAGAVLLTLGPFCEIEVVATWRALGAQSGLPLLIEHGAGDLRPVCDQIGRVRLGRTRDRRRHASLKGRRPRFLVRRKPGRATKPTRKFRHGG